MVKKGALTGLLLFGIFFGAGNLIFPPALGVLSGQNFWPAIFGFVVSGVGLAVLTLIIGTLNPKGYVYEISKKVSPVFATIYLVALYLAIGPFFAIPRTATTAFSVGIEPLLNGFNSSLALFMFTVLYFGAAYLIALNPSKILDSVGRILTPIFALSIVLLIILGLASFSQAPQAAIDGYATAAFGTGFLEGYNTLDALASVAFSVIAVQTLKQLGFTSKKEYITTIWIVGLVVALAFSGLYIGLAMLGNSFPVPADVVANADVNKGVYVLTEATKQVFGSVGQLFLAFMITMTCFTTTAGLIVATGEFFNSRFPQYSYKTFATAFTLIGFAIANLGLNTIITFSVPVLMILYPITIVLVLIVIVNKFVPLSKRGMQVTVGLVTLVSLAEVLGSSFGLAALTTLVQSLPFAAASMAWTTPALAGLLLALVLPDKQKADVFEMETE